MMMRTPPPKRQRVVGDLNPIIETPPSVLHEDHHLSSTNAVQLHEPSDQFLCTYQCRQMVKAEFLDTLTTAEKQVCDYKSKLEELNDNFHKSEADRNKFRDQFLYIEQELAAAEGREQMLQEQLLKEVNDNQERFTKQLRSYNELEGNYVLCSKCFKNENYGENRSMEDFIFKGYPGSKNGEGPVSAEAETLLFLESVFKHGDNWDLVAQSVRTKTRLDCILKLIEGSIPDMTSSTELYVNLQKIYQAKAETDFNVIEQRVKTILKKIGRDPNSISKSTIKTFCKNARKLRLCRYRPIEDEFNSPALPELQKYFTDEDYSVAVGFYVLMRAVDRFAANYNSFPGQFDGAMDDDISRLKITAVGLLGDLGCNGSILTEDLINEMCRFGAAELHAVAAYIGGIASQEVIKLITRQFVPMCGTFIFNGIDHKSQLLTL